MLKWSATDCTDQVETMSVHDIAQPPELSESQYTMYIVPSTSHVVRRTLYIVHRTTFIVAWFPELYESVLKWSATDYTDQARTMSIHDIA